MNDLKKPLQINTPEVPPCPSGILAQLNYANIRTKTTISPAKKPWLNRLLTRAKRYLRSYWQRLMHMDDTARSLSVSIALAIGVAFIPTFGLGIIISLLLAWAFKINKSAAVLVSVALTPFVPFFYAIDIFFAKLFSHRKVIDDLSMAGEIMEDALETIEGHHLFDLSSLFEMGLDIILTSLIICLLLMVILSIVLNKIIIRYKKRRQKKLAAQAKMGINNNYRPPCYIVRKLKTLKRHSCYKIKFPLN